ncbi:MAG: D-2-hydroxyacid dehydrogenase [Treponema sp.]|nr:D-2-hydroxyacid dehydrogenase [Treponema sp.]
MKLVILDGHALNPGDLSYDVFKEFGTLEYYDRTPPELVVERIKDADIVFLNKVAITKEILEQCANLKYIGVFATGYNVIDIAAARAHGITVTNIPAYSTMAVAQATFALLLELTNGVHAHNQSVQNGDWVKSPDFCYWTHPLTELLGKTFGIIGFGSIGQAVARIARALGMKVVAHSRSPKKIADFCKSDFEVESVSLDELLAQSDVVSLHCPLTDTNRGMINSAALAKMKDGAILLNTARGPLVDEAAVKAALQSKKLFGYGADVLCQEPMSADCPLLGAPNCVITPHVAWAAKETRERLLAIAVDNLRKFLAGTPINVVN